MTKARGTKNYNLSVIIIDMRLKLRSYGQLVKSYFNIFVSETIIINNYFVEFMKNIYVVTQKSHI